METTTVCSYCGEPFTYDRKPGPYRKYCKDSCRENAKRLNAIEWNKNNRDKLPKHVVLVLVEPRPLEVMRSTGMTFEERLLLKQRRAAIQIPKEQLAKRIERSI